MRAAPDSVTAAAGAEPGGASAAPAAPPSASPAPATPRLPSSCRRETAFLTGAPLPVSKWVVSAGSTEPWR